MLIHTASHLDKSVQYIVKVDPISLPSAKATPVALTLNELIQNCLDHAFERQATGFIHVGAICSGEELQIVVKDNGQGWDLDTSADTSADTLGTRIIEALVTEDLNGRIGYTVDGGTRVTVCFPLTGTAAN